MEIEYSQLPMPELEPFEYDNMDDWASDTSSIEDILNREPKFATLTKLFEKARKTKMTPVIDPRDVPNV